VLHAPEEGAAISERPRRKVHALCEHLLLDATWSQYEAGERGPDPHVHHQHVDAFYVLEGELEFGVGPDVAPVRAPAGTFVAVPPNIVHTFRNASGATARWLNFHAPSTGFIAYVKGERDGFDSFDAPAAGGRPATEATVTRAGTEGELGREVQFEAMELTVDADFDVAPHVHDDQVNAFFVLDGEVEFAVAGDRSRARRGAWLCAPPGASHGLRATGTGVATVLFIRAPPPGE